jgi:RNA polymerase sporulation-specific sigma factor
LSAFPAVSLEKAEDEKLVLLAREKDEDAFVLLVTRCMPMLQRLSQKYRSLPLEAEDLVQEGLLALLAAVRTYRVGEGISFRTYAYACARNRMISALRGLGGQSADIVTEEPYDPAAQEYSDPAFMVLRREELETLCSRIRGLLSSVEYQVLMLYLGSYSYREIADRLHISTKAVDNALQRLRRKLANAAIF